jgi:hypothetical protein
MVPDKKMTSVFDALRDWTLGGTVRDQDVSRWEGLDRTRS